MNEDSVVEIVNRAAIVCRKYALWNPERFKREFEGINDSIVEDALSCALSNVRDHEVIEVSLRREITKFIGNGIISEVVDMPEYKSDEANFIYLSSDFDDSTLNLAEEDRQREIRRLLAYRYLHRSRTAAMRHIHK